MDIFSRLRESFRSKKSEAKPDLAYLDQTEKPEMMVMSGVQYFIHPGYRENNQQGEAKIRGLVDHYNIKHVAVSSNWIAAKDSLSGMPTREEYLKMFHDTGVSEAYMAVKRVAGGMVNAQHVIVGKDALSIEEISIPRSEDDKEEKIALFRHAMKNAGLAEENCIALTKEFATGSNAEDAGFLTAANVSQVEEIVTSRLKPRL